VKDRYGKEEVGTEMTTGKGWKEEKGREGERRWESLHRFWE